jgi:hypothetical protein
VAIAAAAGLPATLLTVTQSRSMGSLMAGKD